MLILKARKQFSPYRYVVFAGVLVLASFAHLPVSAEDLDQKGYDVAARNDRSDRGFNNSRVELEMVLKNASGAESRRVLEQSTLELPDESVGDKNLIVFSHQQTLKVRRYFRTPKYWIRTINGSICQNSNA